MCPVAFIITSISARGEKTTVYCIYFTCASGLFVKSLDGNFYVNQIRELVQKQNNTFLLRYISLEVWVRKNSPEEKEIAISALPEYGHNTMRKNGQWLVVMGVTGLYKCVCLGIFKLRASLEFKTKKCTFQENC